MLKTTRDHYELADEIDGLVGTQTDGLYVLKGRQKLRATKADTWFVDLRNGTFDFYGYRGNDVVEPPVTPKPVKELRAKIMGSGSAQLNRFL